MPVKTLGDLTTSHILRMRARAAFEYTLFKALKRGDRVGALEMARARGTPELGLVERAAVGAMPTDAMAAAQTLGGAFLASIQQRRILGRLQGSYRAAPSNVRLPSATAAPTAYWHAEGAGQPIVRFTTGLVILAITSLEVLVAFAKTLIERGGAAALGLAEAEMQLAVAVAENATLLDGAPAIAGQRPASILNGVAPTGGGSPQPSPEQYLELLWASVSGGNAVAPVFLTGPRQAIYLATLRVNGVRVFPDITATGGSLLGVEVIVSSGGAGKLVLLDADSLFVADEGLALDESDETTVEMLDSGLQQSGKTGVGAALVSAWQSDLLVLKATRFLNWQLGRADGVGFINLPA